VTRRERVLEHLSEYPSLTAHEIARALGGPAARGGSYSSLLTDMERKGQLITGRQLRNTREARVWSVAPPGTRPKHIPNPDAENKRRRDREAKRRARALAKGQAPQLVTEHTVTRRLALPVAASDWGNWRLRAACRGEDPDLWFSESPQDIERAQQVCAGCPVQAQCLRAAKANREQFGIWAGIDLDVRHAERIAS
jgi:hypothetical protein